MLHRMGKGGRRIWHMTYMAIHFPNVVMTNILDACMTNILGACVTNVLYACVVIAVSHAFPSSLFTPVPLPLSHSFVSHAFLTL